MTSRTAVGRGRRRAAPLLVVLLLASADTFAAGVPKRFESSVTQQVAFDYLLYLPEGYDAATTAPAWPLVLFLHGSGSYGKSLDLVRQGGLPQQMEAGLKVPAIVVAPHAKTWWDELIPALGALLDEVARTHRVDPDRVYVTGLSAGGSGVWALLLQEHERFAAAIPICGAGSRAGIGRLAELPIWVFHGAEDSRQPVEESARMVEAIEKAGGKVAKLTVYPGVGHDAWTRTYADPAVWEWLFAQRRKR
jgi:predicted peptidase